MKFKEGQIMKIGKEQFDIMKIFHDIDWWDSDKNEIIGEHTAIELHKIGDFALYPTHLMKIYYNKKDEAILFRIEQEKTSKEIKNPRQRGGMFSLKDEIIIKIGEIKIEKQKHL
jgi:hypothetical protein